MNFAELWRRLTWVLLAVWCLVCGVFLFNVDDHQVPTVVIVLMVGSGVIFAAMRAIAWIASGLFRQE